MDELEKQARHERQKVTPNEERESLILLLIVFIGWGLVIGMSLLIK